MGPQRDSGKVTAINALDCLPDRSLKDLHAGELPGKLATYLDVAGAISRMDYQDPSKPDKDGVREQGSRSKTPLLECKRELEPKRSVKKDERGRGGTYAK